MYQEVAFLAGSAERQFSTFHVNALENVHEITTNKGVFYKRASLLRQKEDAYHSEEGYAGAAIINVGGIKYRIPWTTLEEFPLTRLGKLRSCNNHEEIMDVCDDYDISCNEFFFDRNPSAFRAIVTFLAAGKLRLLREVCALSFQEELLYWGVEETSLEWCCLRKLRQKQEEEREAQRQDGGQATPPSEEAAPCPQVDEGRVADCMRRLRDMVENPHSGLPGKIFACLSVVFVVITAVTLCISTMPDLFLVIFHCQRPVQIQTKQVLRIVKNPGCWSCSWVAPSPNETKSQVCSSSLQDRASPRPQVWSLNSWY